MLQSYSKLTAKKQIATKRFMTSQDIAASSELFANDIASSCMVVAGSPDTIILNTHCCKKLNTSTICLLQLYSKLRLTALHCQCIAGNFVKFILSPKHRNTLCSIHLIIPPAYEVCQGVYSFCHSVCPSVIPSIRPSVRPCVRPYKC